MTREKILALYAEAVESAEWPEGTQGHYDKEHEHGIRIKEAFYRAAQAEAFEAAANACDCMANGWENNPGNNPMAGYIASSNCAAAIREMAKETK